MASTDNAQKLASEMGNSPQMIYSNYRKLVTKKGGQRSGFRSFPGNSRNRFPTALPEVRFCLILSLADLSLFRAHFM